jgi:pyruvate/2-oxoglutarate dehydrogenase complex dihydrolipoamide dehydrogenase (E3) component
MNARGGIVVDDIMRTSDPNIYAVGDVIGGRTLSSRTAP